MIKQEFEDLRRIAKKLKYIEENIDEEELKDMNNG